MSTTAKNLLAAAATVVFTLAATATTVTNAFAQNAAAPSTTAAASGSAGQNAAAGSALASTKADKPAGLTRAQVQAEYFEARKNGTLIETEVDFDVAQTRKQNRK
jgi:hypothetical protein